MTTKINAWGETPAADVVECPSCGRETDLPPRTYCQNRTAHRPHLTDAQREMLRAAAVAPVEAWEFGAATVSSLRQAGLVEVARDNHGAKINRITDAGRRSLASGRLEIVHDVKLRGRAK